jgi:hypothetical protein
MESQAVALAAMLNSRSCCNPATIFSYPAMIGGRSLVSTCKGVSVAPADCA